MTLLTIYRPNFCSECGDKIVRLRWRIWTSRSFCNKCFSRLRTAHLVRRTFTAFVFVFVGLLIGRGCRREKPALVIQRTASQPSQNSSTAQADVTIEQAYTCGARTKKGTPCSRRVHGPVRCWQHKGAQAMLGAEKLIIKD